MSDLPTKEEMKESAREKGGVEVERLNDFGADFSISVSCNGYQYTCLRLYYFQAVEVYKKLGRLLKEGKE